MWTYRYGAVIEDAVMVGEGGSDPMDFHALEAMQCMLERRKGGETGVKAVQMFTGDAVWQHGFSKELMTAALSRSDTPLGLTEKDGRTQDIVANGELQRMAKDPAAYAIEYRDGTKATMYMLNGAIKDFNFAARLRGVPGNISTQFLLTPEPNVTYSACLVSKIEQMFATGVAPYPVERTQLVSGMLESCLTSKLENGRRLETPHLSVSYTSPKQSQYPKELNMFSRRHLFQNGSLLAAATGFLRRGAAAPARELQLGPNLYESIGVRPLVNCKGTYTIISGSQSLPEVKRAMEEASRHYVQMDELMLAVGQRLAELTKAEWGIVTGGCAAAITHATSACIAGTDPEKMQRLPKLDGLKNQVIMPRYSRNVYDHATRMLGVDVIEVQTPEELERAINPRTAMILILASPPAEKEPTGNSGCCAHRAQAQSAGTGGRRRGIPDHPEHPSGARREHGRLQRWQVHSRSASRRAIAGPEGSAAGGLGQRRSPSRVRTIAEGGQGRDHGHAGRCGDVDQARSQGRVADLGSMAEPHIRSRYGDPGSDHRSASAGGPVQPRARVADQVGRARRWASPAARWKRFCSTATRASSSAAPPARARSRWPARLRSCRT